MSDQPDAGPVPARPSGGEAVPDAGPAASTDPSTSPSRGQAPAPPPHEGDHRDPADARTESERELTETVRSISRLEESN